MWSKRKLLAGLIFLLGFIPCLTAQMSPLYPDGDAKPAISAALAEAAKTHKNVVLDFGGNWCTDCKVMDIYFHQAPNDDLLRANYVIVHVNVGHYDMNLDVAERYGVPLKKGVPALVVLNRYGRIILVQRNGEFERMRKMDSTSVTEFLNKWKPEK